MDLELEGRRALVTGSTHGIGAAIARRLASEGCSVVVHGRDEEAARDVLGTIRAAGGTATAVLGDLTDPEQARRVCADAAQEGPVDILVANAGPFVEHTFFEATDEDWAAAFTGNVLSAVRCVRHLAPSMRDRGWGRIVTISTRGVGAPLTNMVEYSAAKAALANATGALAQELAGSGVTANTVSPGVILTPGMRQMFLDRSLRSGGGSDWDEIESSVTAEYAPNPVGRLGRPEEIADAVAYLVSPRAAYVTGATLRVDGGVDGTLNP
ncbi:SDR family NAD(P)-dependent oxidoreductase [Cellulosimicrobium arenosum]|uniref:SDR family oxidoreductase n=1 Tax=Cellulosimicrobium arenosum TaxID=2708133 RepID=A0A927J1D5_9MICO|nr:SDR family NAD(P)-dependent oxidoreductase [Cellulosimicrobium arenosum]MBD8080038.1 SDR family oxidoreductase [Cellulosimicrobium arenosum]